MYIVQRCTYIVQCKVCSLSTVGHRCFYGGPWHKVFYWRKKFLARECWMIYRGPIFSWGRMSRLLLTHPHGHTSLYHQQVVSLSQSYCVSSVGLLRYWGERRARHTTARKPDPLYIIQYSLVHSEEDLKRTLVITFSPQCLKKPRTSSQNFVLCW